MVQLTPISPTKHEKRCFPYCFLVKKIKKKKNRFNDIITTTQCENLKRWISCDLIKVE